jgi:hypothetical protein
MKKLMTIFGAFFLASVVLTSCGDVNVEDLDKGIDNEEDAVEAMMTIMEAEMEQMKKAMGPWQEILDLKDRSEDIADANKEVEEKIYDEEWDEDDLENADNWDDYEDLKDEYEDIEKELSKITEKVFDW